MRHSEKATAVRQYRECLLSLRCRRSRIDVIVMIVSGSGACADATWMISLMKTTFCSRLFDL
ncbi:hypothetical protein ACPOL_0565 [Acidisarcina polymorpha]|uniref:Uncharacterized protein n=1 Tax=Acidisarcina polymorpha TaxID=2211140 RepID=A0A2Z5FSZ9_9BACT|nr:hypothetical protein ACPOL_0565 [Acidisarcina polymorpha]